MRCWPATSRRWAVRRSGFFGHEGNPAGRAICGMAGIAGRVSATRWMRNSRDIFELSCEKGCRAILDEAEWHLAADAGSAHGICRKSWRRWPTIMSGRWSRFWTMLAILEGRNALLSRGHSGLIGASGRICRTSLRRCTRTAGGSWPTDPQLLSPYRGTGQQLRGGGVPPGRTGLFLCLPGRLFATKHRMGGWEFGRRPHNPAFEVIYVYSQKEGTLDLNFRGSNKAIEPLQGMFATAILKLPELPPDPKDERIYDLNPLRRAGLSICLRCRQRHSGRGSEEAEAVVKGEEGRPHHAGSRCVRQSRCDLRLAGSRSASPCRCTCTT